MKHVLSLKQQEITGWSSVIFAQLSLFKKRLTEVVSIIYGHKIPAGSTTPKLHDLKQQGFI